jgi:RHS repeat-associated protein
MNPLAVPPSPSRDEPADSTRAAGRTPEQSPLPSIAAPKGGGAVRDIGEKFTVNAATGTGAITIPIPVTSGRSGFGPTLSLAYNSGSGNGPFGFGWRLEVASITRKTDKGLPRYDDDAESDVFILSGGEDLVPVLDAKSQTRVRTTRIVHGTTYQITWYRARIEQGFSRVERWMDVATGISHWRSITRDNVTTVYGLDASSCVSDPADATKVYSYLPCQTFDDKGNLCVYEYTADDDRNVDTTTAHEANRTTAARATQRYLKRILYGNAQPYWPDWSPAGDATTLPADWYYQVVLDYGDHSTTNPTPTSDQPWPVRPDPFSRYRSAFEVRTYRRAQRVLVFHNFPNESDVGGDCLVRSLDLVYSDQIAPTDPTNPTYTFLVSVTLSAYRRQATGYLQASMPPIELAYSVPRIQPDVLTLTRDGAANLPDGIDAGEYRWIDLDGEGLTGVLADVGGAWTYKRNTSANNLVLQRDGTVAARARFDPLQMVSTLPSRTTLDANQRLMDLSADGRLDVVALAEPDAGYFERTEEWAWAPLARFAALPQLDWTDPNVHFVDLTGDGLADVLLTEDGLFTLWAARGPHGFASPEQVRTPWDENVGPKVVLADGTETIFLADMIGDGLSDLVRVRNGEVAYWPNLGYGRFGAKVTMDRSPRFTDEERYDPTRVELADIDGSGTADLLYIGDHGVTVCFNQSGNAWAQAQTIAVFPGVGRETRIDVVDLLGTGTACLVWSSPLPSDATRPLRYVDLMGGQKPHLLTMVRNNLGAETRITYAPSTRFYLADRLAGQPWITRMYFPVQVVERVEIFDWIGRSRFVSRYAYHHGFFDGVEREFRGFGRVEQWDTEEHRDDTAFSDGESTNWDAASLTPPMMTCTWFHTGAFVEAGIVSHQYLGEYWPGATPPPDSLLPQGLSAQDEREAYRALKNAVLRQEIYAADGAAAIPYSVADTNYLVTCLQARGPNYHAVFYTNARETVTFRCERVATDPRVTHHVVLEIDAFGNPLRQVSVGYPRRSGYAPPEPTLSAAFQSMLAYDQTRLHISATEQQYTNDLADPTVSPDAHRTPLLCETLSAELTTTPPANVFAFSDLDALWTATWSGAVDIPYEQVPPGDVDGTGAPTTQTRRITGHQQTVYRSDDLTALLPLGQLQSGARSGQSYQLALTPSLVTALFGTLVPAATLTEGGYVQPGGDTNWWKPSGRVYFSPGDTDTPAQELTNAQAHFFLPRRSIDPFGGISRVTPDGYDLLGVATTDAVGNTVSAVNEYRTLTPSLVTDANGNRIQLALDTMGYVVGSAVMGKTTETLGDSLTGFNADLTEAQILAHLADPLSDAVALLGAASCRYVYDCAAYYRTRANPAPAPCVACSVERETHVSSLTSGQTSRIRHLLSYNDGFGRQVQQKMQGAPAGDVDRWIGSGWTIFDNKGRAIRKYEPFYTATPAFEFAAAIGVSTVVLYDPPGRVIAQLHPDNSWDKTAFNAWRQETWDGNDTILISDPRTDADVGPYFARLLGTGPFTSWHDARIGGALGPAQQDAAKKTEAHAATPTVAHQDALGRICLAVEDNGGGNRFPTRTARDCDGHTLAIIDAAGRRAAQNVLGAASPYMLGYDLTGTVLYQNGMDSGMRQTLGDIGGRPLRKWDARGQAFRYLCDTLRRPTHVYMRAGTAPEILLERLVYGEGQPQLNLCTRLFRHYDPAGLASNEQYEFTGNLALSARQLAVTYAASPDWSPTATLTSATDLDAATASMLVAADRFVSTTTFDALNRPVQTVTPHSITMHPNVIQPQYNETGLPEMADVWTQQASSPTALLDPGTANLHAVTNVSYNARGQRIEVDLGNGSTTTYAYDAQTFRLVGLTTTRPASFAANHQTVQDLSYAYDPVGNVTRVTDSADTQDVIFFTNQRVDPTNDYTYDATYRLIAATGREHLGQTQVSNDDSARMNLPQPGDGNAMGVYIESYAYDPVGNILTMAHQVSSGAWTRHYAYATGNRLSTSSLPGDPANGPYAAAYTYDAHGNMLTMPHLPALTWDESDRLRSTTRQAVSTGMPATTYYAYSSTGDRVRKTSTAQTTQRLGVRTIERVYLGPVELVRTFAIDGQTVSIERETLHLMVESHREVIVETRRIGTDKEAATRTRYQYGNVIDSATLELDDQAQIITYEEYFPFGSTSYQAVDAQTETPKRYRYVAKERDEENDLYYYGARYYAPWLARWASCDPIWIADGLNVYAYVHDNPIKLIDPTGTQSEEEPAPPKFQPSLETIPSGPYDTGTVASNNALAEKAEAGIQFHVGHGTLPHMSDEDLASLGLEPPPSDLDEPPEPPKPPAPPPPSNLWVVDKQFSALAGFDPASLGEAVALQGQFVLPHMTLTRLIQGKESAKLGTLFSHEFNLAYGAAPGLTFQGQYLHPQRTTGTADAPYYPGTLQGGLTFNALDLSIKSDKNDSSPKGTPDTRIDLQISAAIQEQLLLREGPNQILFSATATQLSAGIALEYHLTDADSIAAQAGIQSTDWGSSFSAATIFLQYIHHTDPQ